ncbi:hypothetical protein HY732_03715 [Candidatus Uhrbacteria bacterium]|nr:hypothetical protein [Candidatus Uhrbacteria bacterium]
MIRDNETTPVPESEQIEGGDTTHPDLKHGYVPAMGRLLSPDEERAGKRQGYWEARWTGGEAEAVRGSFDKPPERVADGDGGRLELYRQRATQSSLDKNRSALIMDGERTQAVTWEDWDGSGIRVANELFDQLLGGLDIEEQ